MSQYDSGCCSHVSYDVRTHNLALSLLYTHTVTRVLCTVCVCVRVKVLSSQNIQLLVAGTETHVRAFHAS